MAKKVLHLAVLANGQGYHMPKWLCALADAGLKVTLFSYHPPQKPIEGVVSKALNPLVKNRPNWLDFWRNASWLRAQLEALDVDVLMASYATSYGWLAVRCGFQPLLLQTWTLDISHYPATNWRRWILKPIVQRVLHASKSITTDGSALADYLKESYPRVAEKVVPMRWGVRLADYTFDEQAGSSFRKQYDIPNDVPLVVSPRGLQHWYRPEVVLPALWGLLEKHATVHVLVLTVLHDRTSAVQQWLDQLAQHPRAHVIDQFLTTAEMQGLWSAAEIMISLPTDDGISEAVLEAMYAGVFPIVSDIPSNRSFLDEGAAFFVNGDDEQVLTTAILDVMSKLDGEKHQERLARNQTWVAREASVEGTAEKMCVLIESLKEDGRQS